METKTAPAGTTQAPKRARGTKSYILDTNVLLHDPQCLGKFDEHQVVLPCEVLEELDHIKTEQHSERGRNARLVTRQLADLFPDRKSMTDGVKLPSGGSIMVAIRPADFVVPAAAKTVLGDASKKDNLIIATALWVKENFEPPVFLVTKDVLVQLKARACGLGAEDYLNDKVADDVLEDEGIVLPVDGHALQSFASSKMIDLEMESPLVTNEYVLLKDEESGHSIPGRAIAEYSVQALKTPESIHFPGSISIRPRNLEQRQLMDALFDPEITLIAIKAKAGTGKTLLSIAAALAQTVGDNPIYEQVLITRAIYALGKDIGFLPGSAEEKMAPWLSGLTDAIQYLMPARRPLEPQFQGKKVGKKNRNKGGKHQDQQLAGGGNGGGGFQMGPNGKPPMKPHERLMAAGIVNVQPITFLRGRSLPNTFLIVDEAQQLTPHEAKTIVTRMGEHSKLILCGDPKQIDNPYVDEHSNGLVHVISRMRGERFFAAVNLVKGERSHMAEIAANKL